MSDPRFKIEKEYKIGNQINPLNTFSSGIKLDVFEKGFEEMLSGMIKL